MKEVLNLHIWNAIICGVGGQGIMVFKRILENAAFREKQAGGNIRKIIGAEKHGLSQREGATDVCTRFLLFEPDEEYDEFLLTSPLMFYGEADLAIGIEPVELLRNALYLSEKTFIILNTRPIPPCVVISGAMEYPSLDSIINAIKEISESPHLLAVDATALALEQFGNVLQTNMIILGIALATNIIPLKLETIISIIKETISFPENNLKALEIGLKTGKTLLDSSIL